MAKGFNTVRLIIQGFGRRNDLTWSYQVSSLILADTLPTHPLLLRGSKLTRVAPRLSSLARVGIQVSLRVLRRPRLLDAVTKSYVHASTVDHTRIDLEANDLVKGICGMTFGWSQRQHKSTVSFVRFILGSLSIAKTNLRWRVGHRKIS